MQITSILYFIFFLHTYENWVKKQARQTSTVNNSVAWAASLQKQHYILNFKIYQQLANSSICHFI